MKGLGVELNLNVDHFPQGDPMWERILHGEDRTTDPVKHRVHVAMNWLVYLEISMRMNDSTIYKTQIPSLWNKKER